MTEKMLLQVMIWIQSVNFMDTTEINAMNWTLFAAKETCF